MGCSWLRSAATYSDEESARLVELAQSAQQQGEFERAELWLKQAMTANPDDVTVHWQRARLALEQGRTGEAAAALQQVLRLAPNDAEGWKELAHVRQQQHNPEAALKLLTKALELDPRSTDALLLQAEIQEQLHLDEAAMDSYHRVLRLERQNIPAMLRIARLQLKEGRPERAAPLLRSLCQCSHATSNQRADGLRLLGASYAREYRWADAAEAWASVCELREQTTDEDWYRVAYARYQTGETEAARQALASVLSLNPAHPGGQAMASLLDSRLQPGHANPNGILRAGHTVSVLPSPEPF